MHRSYDAVKMAEARRRRARADWEHGARPMRAAAPASAAVIVLLKGLTPEATLALPASTLQIEKFPFRIGRLEPFVENDLMIADLTPWQISRNHVELIESDGRIGVIDRGSRMGSLVDGRPLGGTNGELGPVFFRGDRGVLVLGNGRSPFAYEVLIRSRNGSNKPVGSAGR